MSNGVKARDGYERYYAEKLWQLVPEVYKNSDSSGEFRHIVELIAEEAAESRRSIDRLWEDQNIETSDDWAVPYIGALVGARLVSAQDRRARRVDVANAVRFRRRRGTPDVLDTLARAMSGWDVVLQEGFRRLARTRHRLDGAPRTRGYFTKTFIGGLADLRNPAGAEIADGPFNEFYHTLDTRLRRGRDGLFGPRKLNFHLYRLRPFEMLGVDPVLMEDVDGEGWLRTYTVDPSGRDVALFLAGDGGSVDKTHITRQAPVCVEPLQWRIAMPMRCRLLGHDAYEVSTSDILAVSQLNPGPSTADLGALERARGIRFESETEMRRRLVDLGALLGPPLPAWYVEIVRLSLVEETGKAQAYPSQVEVEVDGTAVPTERISAANLANPACHPVPAGGLATVVISPEQGRFASSPAGTPAAFSPRVARYYYGFPAELGAGPYPRPTVAPLPTTVGTGGIVPDGGVLQGDGLQLADNRTYNLTIGPQTVDDNAVLTVGPQQRPLVQLRGDAASPTRPTLIPAAAQQTFTVDGGWFLLSPDVAGTVGAGETADLVVEGAASNTDNAFDFDRVEIRFATLDPGGTRADGVRIPPLRLFIRARIRTLVIRRSITGPIVVERVDTQDPSVVDELIIIESIIDSGDSAAGVAVSNAFGRVSLEGSTVFGDVNAAVVDSSNSIVVGRLRVVNNQAGCFRFSATVDAPGARLPPRYKDYVGPIPASTFNSARFGDPQYAQLSVVAPSTITEGAENGSEMGAYSHLLNLIRLRSVRAKVNEFGPAGQLAQYLFEGDRAAESLFLGGAINVEPPAMTPPAPPAPGAIIPFPPPPPPPPLPTVCDDDDTPVVLVSIGITPNPIAISVGGRQPMTVTGTYSDGTTADVTRSAVFYSRDPAIAPVDATGLVAGSAAGSTVLTAVVSGVSGTASVSVTAAQPVLTSIEVIPDIISVVVGDQQQTAVIGTYSDGSTADVTNSATFRSSDTALATVDAAGLVTGVAAGQATVTATVDGLNDTVRVQIAVAPVVLVSIVVSPDPVTLQVGDVRQLTVVGTYSNNTTADVTGLASFTSSDTTVATVGLGGLVTGVGAGSSVLTATVDGLSDSADATVAALPAVLTGLAVTPNPVMLVVGASQQLTVTGTFSDGSTADVTRSATFSSRLPITATVDPAGVVVARAPGTTDVVASVSGLTDTVRVMVAAVQTVTSEPVRELNWDLNCMPDFWRDLSPKGRPGVPFDKVDFVVEYDARMGVRPEQMGWTGTGPVSSQYVLSPGELRFRITDGPAYYSQVVPIVPGAVRRVFAYAAVLMSSVPVRGGARGEAFELRFETNASAGGFGERAAWDRVVPDAPVFNYVSLDDQRRTETATREPYDRLLNTCMCVSLYADVGLDQALMSLADVPDQVSLSWFGSPREDFGAGPSLRVLFGGTASGAAAVGRLRHLVVANGRFPRVWMQGAAPTDSPRLRLRFVVDGPQTGGAAVRVRYSSEQDRPAFNVPPTVVDALLTVTAADAGRILTLDLPLERAVAGSHLLITIERDWRRPEDTLRETARLLSADLL